MHTKVLAVIVSYNPNIADLVNNLKAVTEQGASVLLVDNASENQDELSRAIPASSSLEVSLQAANLGLGGAHNIGIDYANQQGFDYVLLLDQDTQLHQDTLVKLLTAHQSKTNQGVMVSAVGCSYAHGRKKQSEYIRFGRLKFTRHTGDEQDQDGCVATDFLISSGSLFSLAALDAIGPMDEGLFIDHIDTEWFLRAGAKGWQAYGVCDALMHHGLGETAHAVRLAGRDRDVPQHKPFRYYYIFRNSIALYARSYPNRLWKWNDVQRLTMMLIMFGLLKPPRWQNLAMMLKGVWHGLRGISGPMPSTASVSR